MLSKILNLKVSFQRNTWAGIGQELTIFEVFEQIKSDIYKNEIHKLRNLIAIGDLENYGIHKKTLPCVTFCGTFNQSRKKEDIKVYNSLIVIDIDKLDEENFTQAKSSLETSPYVLAYWTSPSGTGLKGLVQIEFDFDQCDGHLDFHHKRAFSQLSSYFENNYSIELDESGSDTTRLCFLTHDLDIRIKPHFNTFKVTFVQITPNTEKTNKQITQKIERASKDLLSNPSNRNNPFNRKTIQSIIKFLTKNSESITFSYEQWFRVAFAIADSFTYDIGEKYFLDFSAMDAKKFNATNCRAMLHHAYSTSKGQITFNTIVYLANQRGYLTKTQKREVSKVGS